MSVEWGLEAESVRVERDTNFTGPVLKEGPGYVRSGVIHLSGDTFYGDESIVYALEKHSDLCHEGVAGK